MNRRTTKPRKTLLQRTVLESKTKICHSTAFCVNINFLTWTILMLAGCTAHGTTLSTTSRSERKVFKSTVLHSKYSHPVCLRTGRALLWEVPTCWGLCRDCSGPGCLVLWWQRRTRTLVELVQTQTAALQTEDSGLRCLLSQASPLPLLESE